MRELLIIRLGSCFFRGSQCDKGQAAETRARHEAEKQRGGKTKKTQKNKKNKQNKRKKVRAPASASSATQRPAMTKEFPVKQPPGKAQPQVQAPVNAPPVKARPATKGVQPPPRPPAALASTMQQSPTKRGSVAAAFISPMPQSLTSPVVQTPAEAPDPAGIAPAQEPAVERSTAPV